MNLKIHIKIIPKFLPEIIPKFPIKITNIIPQIKIHKFMPEIHKFLIKIHTFPLKIHKFILLFLPIHQSTYNFWGKKNPTHTSIFEEPHFFDNTIEYFES